MVTAIQSAIDCTLHITHEDSKTAEEEIKLFQETAAVFANVTEVVNHIILKFFIGAVEVINEAN
ncbi:hypothetical protein H6S82_30205 [Planktothrix sp. FACHB-1355]|uniref:Uncharacterized protein n=1 Tax=Aerosakkonema funiforme FACHB-1375 TaxID=2949571 RepID=A0A926VH15_9CYAN|nr:MULTISPECIES: hypothetical protein [Oscillatoriales]MBD2182973.1 hypothetical protein [Aerosakkonema funiforme FACHB-1375]MBD3563084.1 hypothetical protein [Planktothrix sp. FACHB-1355]